ncbi:MAG: hypothetical protein H0X29_09150 [Parachlamydiaceae bacterium]|nr:hypothetical protein [Parachlamydiaceae bacterium]
MTSILSGINPQSLKVKAEKFNLPSNSKDTNKRTRLPSPPVLCIGDSVFGSVSNLAESTASLPFKDQGTRYYRRLSEVKGVCLNQENNEHLEVISRPLKRISGTNLEESKGENDLDKSKKKIDRQFEKMFGVRKV